MAAFIVVDINNPQIDTLVFKASITFNGASSTRFNFFRKVLKTFSRYINGRRFAYCGIPSLTFRFGCPHLAPVCWRGLSLKVHLSAPVSWCWKKHNSDTKILDSLCCLDHSNLAEDPSSQSRGSLTPNQIQKSRFGHCRTFCFRFVRKWLQENIEKFGPTHHV